MKEIIKSMIDAYNYGIFVKYEENVNIKDQKMRIVFSVLNNDKERQYVGISNKTYLKMSAFVDEQIKKLKKGKYKPDKLFLLMKAYSEWRIQNYIGHSSATPEGIAEFLNSIANLGFELSPKSSAYDIRDVTKDIEYELEIGSSVSALEGKTVTSKKEARNNVLHQFENKKFEYRIFLRKNKLSRQHIGKITIETSEYLENIDVLQTRVWFDIDGFIEHHFHGGDGNDLTWLEIPSKPRIYMRDIEDEYYLTKPTVDLYFDEVNTDGAFLPKENRKILLPLNIPPHIYELGV